MPTVLIKREDGTAFISFTNQTADGWEEGGARLSPDDVVDGKKVKDWPAGVFTVNHVIWEGALERFTDWNAKNLDVEGDDDVKT